jgi:hypothetical protein
MLLHVFAKQRKLRFEMNMLACQGSVEARFDATTVNRPEYLENRFSDNVGTRVTENLLVDSRRKPRNCSPALRYEFSPVLGTPRAGFRKSDHWARAAISVSGEEAVGHIRLKSMAQNSRSFFMKQSAWARYLPHHRIAASWTGTASRYEAISPAHRYEKECLKHFFVLLLA